MSLPDGYRDIVHEQVMVVWYQEQQDEKQLKSLGSLSPNNKLDTNFTFRIGFDGQNMSIRFILPVTFKIASPIKQREIILALPLHESVLSGSLQYEQIHTAEVSIAPNIHDAGLSASGFIIKMDLNLANIGRNLAPQTISRILHPATRTSREMLIDLHSLSQQTCFTAFLKPSDYAREGLKKASELINSGSIAQAPLDIFTSALGKHCLPLNWANIELPGVAAPPPYVPDKQPDAFFNELKGRVSEEQGLPNQKQHPRNPLPNQPGNPKAEPPQALKVGNQQQPEIHIRGSTSPRPQAPALSDSQSDSIVPETIPDDEDDAPYLGPTPSSSPIRSLFGASIHSPGEQKRRRSLSAPPSPPRPAPPLRANTALPQASLQYLTGPPHPMALHRPATQLPPHLHRITNLPSNKSPQSVSHFPPHPILPPPPSCTLHALLTSFFRAALAYNHAPQTHPAIAHTLPKLRNLQHDPHASFNLLCRLAGLFFYDPLGRVLRAPVMDSGSSIPDLPMVSSIAPAQEEFIRDIGSVVRFAFSNSNNGSGVEFLKNMFVRLGIKAREATKIGAVGPMDVEKSGDYRGLKAEVLGRLVLGWG